eukprot:m.313747 g.313747  ORF g.313747 m.313747 type:complete len:476 (-) comp16491_c9_seq23:93-1520(-)
MKADPGKRRANKSACWNCVYRFMHKKRVPENKIRAAHLRNRLPKEFYLHKRGGTRLHEKCLFLENGKEEQGKFKVRLNKAREKFKCNNDQPDEAFLRWEQELELLTKEYFEEHDQQRNQKSQTLTHVPTFNDNQIHEAEDDFSLPSPTPSQDSFLQWLDNDVEPMPHIDLSFMDTEDGSDSGAQSQSPENETPPEQDELADLLSSLSVTQRDLLNKAIHNDRLRQQLIEKLPVPEENNMDTPILSNNNEERVKMAEIERNSWTHNVATNHASEELDSWNEHHHDNGCETNFSQNDVSACSQDIDINDTSPSSPVECFNNNNNNTEVASSGNIVHDIDSNNSHVCSNENNFADNFDDEDSSRSPGSIKAELNVRYSIPKRVSPPLVGIEVQADYIAIVTESLPYIIEDVQLSTEEDDNFYHFNFKILFNREPTEEDKQLVSSKIKSFLLERFFEERMEPPKVSNAFLPSPVAVLAC